MVAAAITVWAMFSLWLVAPHIGAPRAVRTAAAAVLCAELVSVLVWSYGAESCDERTCAPLAQAAGIAARTDVPALAAVVLVVSMVRMRRAVA
jgi:hypothetical protein